MDEETVLVPVEVVPESPENLSFHLGQLRADHDSLRRDMESHREEVASLRALHQTLLDELQTVEEVVEEIQTEDTSVEDTAVVDDPVSHHEPKKAHFLTRMLRGHN